MGLDQTKIANIAIRDVGGTPLTDVSTDTGKEAELVRTYWEAVTDECLRAHKWTFARKTKALAADGDYDMVDDRYSYAYQKPADCVKLSRMNVKGTNYEIRGSHILCNSSPLIIEYIYRHENYIEWPSYFYMAVAAHLSSFLALSLSKKGSKKVDWSQLYLYRLKLGKDEDSQMENPYDDDAGLHTVANETWLTVRG